MKLWAKYVTWLWDFVGCLFTLVKKKPNNILIRKSTSPKQLSFPTTAGNDYKCMRALAMIFTVQAWFAWTSNLSWRQTDFQKDCEISRFGYSDLRPLVAPLVLCGCRRRFYRSDSSQSQKNTHRAGWGWEDLLKSTISSHFLLLPSWSRNTRKMASGQQVVIKLM